jgi:hypothetical protein
MNLEIQYVPTEHVAQSWGQVEKFLADALKHGTDDYNIDQLKAMTCMGNQLLLVAVDEESKVHGAATISFINYPNHRVAFITAIGGKLITGADTFQQLRRVLGLQGATKIQGAVRPSMAKLSRKYGFSEVAALVEVKL